jgi:maltose O-acetyltransferase
MISVPANGRFVRHDQITVESLGATVRIRPGPVRSCTIHLMDSPDMARSASPPSPSRLLRRAMADPRDAIRSAIAVARSAIAFRRCRHVGFGPRLYGRCYVMGGAGIEIGDRLLMRATMAPCELATHAGGQLRIGDRVFVNHACSISAHDSVRIGNDCKLGQYSIILDCDFHDLTTPTHDGSHGEVRPVLLEDGVWLGARVTVLPGVTIGRSSVIATGSVVTRDIPPGVLAAGMPARVLRELSLRD